MMTEVLTRLLEAPVEPTGQRLATFESMSVVDTSTVEDDPTPARKHFYQEKYRREVSLFSQFVIARSAPGHERRAMFDNLNKQLAELLYGELRRKIHEMMPLLYEIPCAGREPIARKLELMLELMEPDR